MAVALLLCYATLCWAAFAFASHFSFFIFLTLLLRLCFNNSVQIRCFIISFGNIPIVTDVAEHRIVKFQILGELLCPMFDSRMAQHNYLGI